MESNNELGDFCCDARLSANRLLHRRAVYCAHSNAFADALNGTESGVEFFCELLEVDFWVVF